MGTPVGVSTTVCRGTEPDTVSMAVPGSPGAPAEPKRMAPMRAPTAIWVKVSVLEKSVGIPPTPDSLALTFLPGGSGRPPLAAEMMPEDSPDTKRSGMRTMRARSWRPRLVPRPRSARASRTDCSLVSRVTLITSSRAPRISAHSRAPSSIRWGARRRITASLRQAGSPSQPLTTTAVGLPRRRAASPTALSFL